MAGMSFLFLDFISLRKSVCVFSFCHARSFHFRVIVFKPYSDTFRASPRLCICKACKEEYGSCSLFESYSQTVLKYNKPFLRSNDDTEVDFEEIEREWDFLPNETIVAVANESKHDNVWFIQIVDNNCVLNNKESDSYGNVVVPGVRFLKGHFL